MRHRHAILHLPFAIAGDWLGFPLGIRAPQRFARCISKCMGLILRFRSYPTPLHISEGAPMRFSGWPLGGLVRRFV
jgi:hypothetical protein